MFKLMTAKNVESDILKLSNMYYYNITLKVMSLMLTFFNYNFQFEFMLHMTKAKLTSRNVMCVSTTSN